jgi:hypothetical protein
MTANPIQDTTIHEVAVKKLQGYKNNPRIGNIEKIAESLEANGQFRPIIVRRETSEILAGNHTWKAAQSLGWDTIKVSYVENLTDEQAARIVIADNRLPDLGEYNSEALAELLASVVMEDGTGLAGTGYEASEVESILREVNAKNEGALDPYEEWAGMPEFKQDNKMSVFHATVHFATEADANEFFELIGSPKKSSLWYPENDGLIGSNVNEAYISE